LHHLRQWFGGKKPYPKFKITHNEFLQSRRAGSFSSLSRTKPENFNNRIESPTARVAAFAGCGRRPGVHRQ
jgi:hypothetical protein